jgi:hypothetical protein
MEMRRINTKAELVALARELGVRPDWHEPDESGVNALVSGHVLDNAGFWGEGGTGTIPSWAQEMWVTITVETEGVKPRGVAEVNLAMLLAFYSSRSHAMAAGRRSSHSSPRVHPPDGSSSSRSAP